MKKDILIIMCIAVSMAACTLNKDISINYDWTMDMVKSGNIYYWHYYVDYTEKDGIPYWSEYKPIIVLESQHDVISEIQEVYTHNEAKIIIEELYSLIDCGDNYCLSRNDWH